MCFYFHLTDKELPKCLMPMQLLTLLKLLDCVVSVAATQMLLNGGMGDLKFRHLESLIDCLLFLSKRGPWSFTWNCIALNL